MEHCLASRHRKVRQEAQQPTEPTMHVDSPTVFWYQIIVAGSLLLGLLGAMDIGFRLGRRRRRASPDEHSQIGTLQGALLGLLGLLMGFAFSGAMTRFIDRQDGLVRDANAISTAMLRAALLPEPHRQLLRESLRSYAVHRLELSRTMDATRSAQIMANLDADQARIWSAALEGVNQRTDAMMAVLGPVNEVLDQLAARNALAARHIPKAVTTLLVACALLSIGTIGYGCGLSNNRQRGVAAAMSVLVASALWLTIDLDYPRVGLVRINTTPLVELVDSLGPRPAPTGTPATTP